MKPITIISLSCALACSLLYAEETSNEKSGKTEVKAEKAVSNQSRIPIVTIDEAIKLVRNHHNNKQGMEPVFVDVAIFIREKSNSYWKIGVRNAKQETGHLFYKVSGKKEVETLSVVKDG